MLPVHNPRIFRKRFHPQVGPIWEEIRASRRLSPSILGASFSLIPNPPDAAMKQLHKIACLSVALGVLLLSAGCDFIYDFHPGKGGDGPDEVCQVIDFDDFAHGGAVTSVSVLGVTLDVSAERFPPDAATGIAAQALDTDSDPAVAPDDLVWTPPGGECTACEGLGRVLIIPRSDDSPNVFDHPQGGHLTFSGFSASDNLYVKSFLAVDDDADEPSMKLFVDGTQVAESSSLGNGTVEIVTPTSEPTINDNIAFRLGDETDPDAFGSGAIDEVEICRCRDDHDRH